MKIDHALVIGGTGMLRRATVAIAEHSRRLTAVAKTAASLGTLARLQADRGGDRYETLDWDQPEQFVLGLQRLVSQVGHPTLVLAWLHDMHLAPRLAKAISSPRTPCDFFQIISSSEDSPQGGATALRAQVEALSDVRYFQVVLGFKRESGASRWLTDDEISEGALEAIRKREPCHIVGTVSAWEQRPK